MRGISLFWSGGAEMLEKQKPGTCTLGARSDHRYKIGCVLASFLRTLFHLDFTKPLNMSQVSMMFETFPL
jgi:hypothetical protein